MAIEELSDLKARIAQLEGELKAREEDNSFLRDKAAQLETIFRAIPDAAAITDMNRHIVMANPGVERVFGYTPEEVLGRTTQIFYESEEDYKNQGRLRYNATADEQLKPYEMHYTRKDGTRFPSDTVGASITDGEGKRLGFLGIMRDTTEQVELRELRRKVGEELEKRVRERTGELHALTHTLSHDLKSPIIAIAGFAKLLQRKLGPEFVETKEGEYVERILDAVDWVQQLLDDLVDLFKARDAQISMHEVDMGQLVDKVVAISRGMLEEGGVEVEVGGEFPSVCCDEHMIRRVLENLVQNSLKFIGAQPNPKIAVKAFDKEGIVEVVVSDNGPGIAPEYLESIFTPFVRLNAMVKGSGLGLAITKRFVELHGGDVWVDAGLGGKGSSFHFTLPKFTPPSCND